MGTVVTDVRADESFGEFVWIGIENVFVEVISYYDGLKPTSYFASLL